MPNTGISLRKLEIGNSFFNFMQYSHFFSKLDEAVFFKSLGFLFDTNDLEKITEKDINSRKNKCIASLLSQIIDTPLQRFYGTLITENCSIEGLKLSDSSELFQYRINSLNKGEKLYKIHINKNADESVFKLKENHSYSINFMPLLNGSVGQYILLE